jgi:transposase-like protein
MCDLTAPQFKSEEAARQHLEAIRWPTGPVCPHCGVVGGHYALTGTGGAKGTKARPGLYKCHEYRCRKQFSVTVGTVFERSKIPLSKWLMAVHLMCASKKGISAKQIERMFGIQYRSAWFMCHRIREAMKPGGSALMGSGGGMVEVDETFIGNKRSVKPKGQKKGRGYFHKYKVLSLVDRKAGRARSIVLDNVSAKCIAPILRANIAKEATLMTDEAFYYTKIGREFAGHETVNHFAGEYGRGIAHTNTIEGFFSVFKRGMKGIYQHCGEQHLHRYLNEFDYRYNHRSANGFSDSQRAAMVLARIGGKRLMYRD